MDFTAFGALGQAADDVVVPPSPAPEPLPLLQGRLCGTLKWFPDYDGSSREVASCSIQVACCFCSETHTHGWRLDGRRRVEERVSHCFNGHYLIEPAADREVHAWSPSERRSRASQSPMRAAPKSDRPEGLGLLAWIRLQNGVKNDE